MGYNFLQGYSILCHLKRKNLKRNVKYLQEYSKQQKLIYLPEDNVIFIDDDKISIIGNSKYIIFKNGEYVFHHFANFKNDIYKDKFK